MKRRKRGERKEGGREGEKKGPSWKQRQQGKRKMATKNKGRKQRKKERERKRKRIEKGNIRQ